MRFGEIVAPTIKDLFVEKIEGLILSGRLLPGERMPSERELAQEMKISKTVVHAGMQDLQRMGFIEVVPRQGTFVSNYAETGTLETLNAILKYNGGQFDKVNTESLFEFRLALEGAAFKKFAIEHTQE
ncbi:MAG: winged helix-turn-helix domain-containing protein, partial [Acutalibacteraceae bacterium]